MTKTKNSVLMNNALLSLEGKWLVAVLGVIIYFTLTLSIPFILSRMLGMITFSSFEVKKITQGLIAIIINGPFILGFTIFFLSISRGIKPKLSLLFEGFENLARATGAYILMSIIISFGFVLLIVPGIIASLALSQTFFIMADNKNIGIIDALKQSARIMNENKMKLLMMWLIILAWAIACILTFGIGFLWLVPYAHVSLAKFYDDIKTDRIE